MEVLNELNLLSESEEQRLEQRLVMKEEWNKGKYIILIGIFLFHICSS